METELSQAFVAELSKIAEAENGRVSPEKKALSGVYGAAIGAGVGGTLHALKAHPALSIGAAIATGGLAALGIHESYRKSQKLQDLEAESVRQRAEISSWRRPPPTDIDGILAQVKQPSDPAPDMAHKTNSPEALVESEDPIAKARRDVEATRLELQGKYGKMASGNEDFYFQGTRAEYSPKRM